MADETGVAGPGVTAPASALDIHPKVTLSVFAGSAAAVLIGLAKAKGIDLSGYEANIVVLVMGLAGYFAPGAADSAAQTDAALTANTAAITANTAATPSNLVVTTEGEKK